MSLRLKFILLLLLPLLMGYGQSGFTSLGGANFAGFGRAGVNIDGIESIYANQAGLTGVKNIGFDISFERRFNLEELTHLSIAGAKKLGIGTVGFVVSSFGFSDYSEQKFGLSYARALGKSVSIGGQFDMLKYNISQFGTKNIFTFEMGAQIKINREFSIATHVFSPGNITISEGNDLGTRFKLGLKFAPSTKVFVLAELDKLVYRALEYKLGIGYQVVKDLQLRFGVNPSTETFSFGARFVFQNSFKISSAYSLNNNLGNTPSLSLQYQK